MCVKKSGYFSKANVCTQFKNSRIKFIINNYALWLHNYLFEAIGERKFFSSSEGLQPRLGIVRLIYPTLAPCGRGIISMRLALKFGRGVCFVQKQNQGEGKRSNFHTILQFPSLCRRLLNAPFGCLSPTRGESLKLPHFCFRNVVGAKHFLPQTPQLFSGRKIFRPYNVKLTHPTRARV